MIQSSDLRADTKIREIATKMSDAKILAITAREIVAEEAHYHASCYRNYTRVKANNQEIATDSVALDDNDDYKSVETTALRLLYKFIRIDLFSNPRIVPLHDLTLKVVAFISDEGVVVKQSTRTHLRRKLESEFGDSLHFFTAGTGNRVYVRPDNLAADTIACDFINMKDKLDTYTHSQECEQLIVQVAVILRDRIKDDIKEQAWPPNPQDLTEK